jgi:ABC-type arginine/histidine transport system permease subunit
MASKKALFYSLFVVVSSIWLVFLLAVYLQTRNWETQTFPSAITPHVLIVFSGSTFLLTLTSFSVGLGRPGKLSKLRKQCKQSESVSSER